MYLLHGMKRSGNHGFVRWLLPQIDGTFINNAIPVGPILRGVKALPEPMPLDTWLGGKRDFRGRGETSLLVGLEDLELTATPLLANADKMRKLLILRRPEQMFSSRLRHASRVEMVAFPRQNDDVMRRAVSVWKQHARCFLGIESVYSGRIAISFEAWVVDREYRQAICEALGIGFDDSAYGRVGQEGGGSSFDGMSFDGSSHLMNVLDRVSQLVPEERDVLDEILKDPELQSLSEIVHKADPYRQIQMISRQSEHT
ncbi:MAG: hypothetical protein L0H23_01015 [Luteimonas sp.]|nr:hypothetical protein [Luteimonas sp.]